MNYSIRKAALAAIVMIVVLLGNITYVQFFRGPSLRNDPHNAARTQIDEFSRQRGQITAKGQVLATSEPSGDMYKYQRIYPNSPAMYAPLTGYYSLYNRTNLELSNDPLLSGSADDLFGRRLIDLFTGRTPRGGSIELTIDPAAQKAAWDGLQAGVGAGPVTGAVVALRPSTGEILAMASTPSYDPNTMAVHDPDELQAAEDSLRSASEQPDLNRATQNPLAPGSSFKVVTTSTLLQHGVTPNEPVSGAPSTVLPLTTTELTNYNGKPCGGGGTTTLTVAFEESCNVPFAELAQRISPDDLKNVAAGFGIGETYDIGVPTTASSLGDIIDAPSLAQSVIGQRDVAITPLQNAIIAATIANGGVRMKPYLVKRTLSPDLTTLSVTTPEQVTQAVPAEIADQVKDMMLKAEDHASGSGKVPGVTIASKTGTAEHGDDPSQEIPYTTYIAFNPDKDVAVAVTIESGPGMTRQTVGATSAGPIGRAVIATVAQEGDR